MYKLLLRLKDVAFRGFKKYGKLIGILWLVSFIIMLPLMFIIGGWPLLVGYLTCKLTGVCPI